jgi:hypothetical protein
MKLSIRLATLLAAAGLAPAAIISAGPATASTAGPAHAAAAPAPTAAYHATTASLAPGSRLWVRKYVAGPDRSVVTTYATAVSPDGSTVYVTGLAAKPTPYHNAQEVLTVAYHASTGATLWSAEYHGNTDFKPISYEVLASPDGNEVLVVGAIHVRAVAAYYILAYDAQTGASLWTDTVPFFNLGLAQQPAVLSPDGSQLFVLGGFSRLGSPSYYVAAYNTTTGVKNWSTYTTMPHVRYLMTSSIAVSPDGSDVFVSGPSGTVAYDASSGTQIWADHYKRLWYYIENYLAVSPDSSTVYVSSRSDRDRNDHWVTTAYSAATGATLWTKLYGTLKGSESNGPDAVAVSPDGSVLYVTGNETLGKVRDFVTIAYQAATGSVLWTSRLAGLGLPYNEPTAIAVSPDGSEVFVTGKEENSTGQYTYNDVTLAYSATQGSQLWTDTYALTTAYGPSYGPVLVVNPDGNQVYVSGFDQTVAYQP